MSMYKVDTFSKYPSINGELLTKHDLSDFRPATVNDLVLCMMAEVVVGGREFFDFEGWPYDGWGGDGKNTNIGRYWARDLVKDELGFIDGPLVRRVYDLRAKKYSTKIITPDKIITTGTLESDGKEKIEAELKEIFSK